MLKIFCFTLLYFAINIGDTGYVQEPLRKALDVNKLHLLILEESEDSKALLSNKMIRLDQVILLAYKAKNADIALAKASIFNVVGEQKNTYKWSGYYITEPKYLPVVIVTNDNIPSDLTLIIFEQKVQLVSSENDSDLIREGHPFLNITKSEIE